MTPLGGEQGKVCRRPEGPGGNGEGQPALHPQRARPEAPRELLLRGGLQAEGGADGTGGGGDLVAFGSPAAAAIWIHARLTSGFPQ